MKLTKLLALLALSFAILLTSCEEDTNDPIDNTLPKPAAPTDLMANSYETDADGATISLKWTPSTSEGTTNFANYELTILNENNAPVGNVMTLSATDNPYTIDANLLDQGMVYTFELRAVNADEESDAATIMWSPAWRFVEDSGFPLELYGVNGDFGSGLDLYDDGAQGTVVRTVNSGDMWNLGFDDRNGNLLFGSASALSYNVTPEDAEIMEMVGLVSSLNDMYFDKPLDEYNYNTRAIDLTQYNQSIALVVRVETSAGTGVYNYARVYVDYGPNGFVRDAGTDNQYIVVQVSYQAEVDVPYAKIGKAE
jgi:hypothetical protein